MHRSEPAHQAQIKEGNKMISKEHAYAELLKTHRRNLHMIPELDRHLPKTKAYLNRILKELDCKLTYLCDSGVCAFFDKGKEDTYCFRAEMDALPGVEAMIGSYASKHEGIMHSCGHDGHMAINLAFGQYIDSLDTADHNVLLIFQPAEETLGGAKEICESGIFSKYNVTKVFGIHIWPFIEAGALASKRGAIMAKSAEIDIDILGESAHGTAAYEGKDALYIASDFMTRLYRKHAASIGAVQHFAEDVDPLPKAHPCKPEDKTIIHIGRMDSGYARNVVSNNTRLQGTVRAFSEENFANTLAIITDTLKDITEQYGCDATFTNSEGYPPIINDEALYLESSLAAKSLDCCYTELTEPVMASDDFSFYGHYAPSVFFLLGTGGDIPLHSVEFDFDESILISGFELYKALLSC